MEKYLITRKQDILNLKNIVERKAKYIDNEEFINVVIGPRRAGKSYFLYDIIKNKLKLKEDEFLYINFEEIIEEDVNISKLPFLHKEIYGNYPQYLFFDEIQSIENWEKHIYNLYESKRYKIFITGSNSKLLSKEIATQLRGRTYTIKIYPFSFDEVFNVSKKYLSEYEIADLKRKLRKFIMSQFPVIYLEKHPYPKEFFVEYLNLIIYKDIVERYNVRNYKLLDLFIKNLLLSFTKEFSISKFYNFLKTQNYDVSKPTLYNFQRYLEDVFLVFFIRKYSDNFRTIEQSKPKIYWIDNGPYCFLVREEKGKLLENYVFCELLKKGFDKVFYYRTKNNEEIDFIVKTSNGLELIEVTYEFDQEHINKVFKAMDELDLKEGVIITWDDEDLIEKNGKRIKVVPLWKWLLSFH
jgi:predicted AAA+ superfamily ATPase